MIFINMDNLQFIEDILLEICADSRITDGIFKIQNSKHIDILKEYLYKSNIDKDIIDEYIKSVMDESAASERAHNKGWTFKSGFWWRGGEKIARTVKGKLLTLSQIERLKKIKERERELEKLSIEARKKKEIEDREHRERSERSGKEEKEKRLRRVSTDTEQDVGNRLPVIRRNLKAKLQKKTENLSEADVLNQHSGDWDFRVEVPLNITIKNSFPKYDIEIERPEKISVSYSVEFESRSWGIKNVYINTQTQPTEEDLYLNIVDIDGNGEEHYKTIKMIIDWSKLGSNVEETDNIGIINVDLEIVLNLETSTAEIVYANSRINIAKIRGF